jgi:plasmid stabilization system protein ParE
MAYRIEFTARAEADIDGVVEYIRQQAPMHAVSWYQGLKEAIQTLSEMPMRCPLAPEGKRTRRDIRQLLYGKRSGVYRVIFRIEEKAKGGPVVRILHIRHGSRARLNIKDLEAEQAPKQTDEPTPDRPARTRSKDRDR